MIYDFTEGEGKKKADEFFKLVEENDSIVIFGHVWPDGDCYGSTEGLKSFLKEIYPQKKILVSATDCPAAPYSFPHADAVSDEDIRNSLHIVCDLPDKGRCGDPRCFTIEGKGFIKLDHHYPEPSFGGLEIIDKDRGSACDLIADLIYSRYPHMNKTAASCFYLGITTDTGRFQYSPYPRLFKIAEHLMEDGAEVSAIYEHLYSVKEESVTLKGYYMTHYKTAGLGVNYIFMDKETCRKFHLSGHSAALGVNNIGNIEASRLWAAFGEDPDGKVYGEFRSLGNKVNVQKIASMFNGGGHFNASGNNVPSKDVIPDILKACEEEELLAYGGEYVKELKTLLDLCLKSMKIIKDIYQKSSYKVEIKSDNSPVTDADKASDALIRDTLKKEYPEYGLLTEEDKNDFTRLKKQKVFIIDPLDGTSDFVGRTGEFVVNLALADNHVPAVGVIGVPLKGEIYFAVKGQGAYHYIPGHVLKEMHVSSRLKDLIVLHSRMHLHEETKRVIAENQGLIKEAKPTGSALKDCLIAEGKGDLTFEYGGGTKEWDTCAPQIIVTEAGGVFMDTKGNPITYNREDVYNHDGYVALNRLENAWNLKK